MIKSKWRRFLTIRNKHSHDKIILSSSKEDREVPSPLEKENQKCVASWNLR